MLLLQGQVTPNSVALASSSFGRNLCVSCLSSGFLTCFFPFWAVSCGQVLLCAGSPPIAVSIVGHSMTSASSRSLFWSICLATAFVPCVHWSCLVRTRVGCSSLCSRMSHLAKSLRTEPFGQVAEWETLYLRKASLGSFYRKGLQGGRLHIRDQVS